MKLIKTTGRNAKDAYALLATLERRGAVKTAEVETTVRKIMLEVQKKGDKALQKFAEKFDSLQGAIRVTPGEMLDAASRSSRSLMSGLRRTHPASPSDRSSGRWSPSAATSLAAAIPCPQHC